MNLRLRDRKIQGRSPSDMLGEWVGKGVEVLTWIRTSDVVTFSTSANSFLIAARCLWSLRLFSSCNIPCVKSESYMNEVTTSKLNGRLTIRSTLVCINSFSWWLLWSSFRSVSISCFWFSTVVKWGMMRSLKSLIAL